MRISFLYDQQSQYITDLWADTAVGYKNTILPSTFSESHTIHLCMRWLIASLDLLIQVLMQPRGYGRVSVRWRNLLQKRRNIHGDTRLDDDDDGRGDL